MNMQQRLDAQYTIMQNQMAVDFEKKEKIAAPKRRRSSIINEINNNPDDYRVGSSFEGFLMCFSRPRMMFKLKRKEIVIVKHIASTQRCANRLKWCV